MFICLFLGLLFMGLKLSHKIDWSWWWVTCPFWITPVSLLILGLVFLQFLPFYQLGNMIN